MRILGWLLIGLLFMGFWGKSKEPSKPEPASFEEEVEAVKDVEELISESPDADTPTQKRELTRGDGLVSMLRVVRKIQEQKENKELGLE